MCRNLSCDYQSLSSLKGKLIVSAIVRQYTNKFINKFVKKKKKSLFKKIVVSIFRTIARQRWFALFLVKYITSELVQLSKSKVSNNKIVLLILNEERFRADLEVLAEHPDVELLSLPSRVQHLINSIWVSSLRDKCEKNPTAYFECVDSEIVQARAQLRKLLARLIPRVVSKCNISAIATCTFYYRQDKDWEIVATKCGIPFYAIHKENMKDPVTHEISIENYKSKFIKFYGTRIFLFNEYEKYVLINANITESNKVSVIGGLRMDRIYKKTSIGKISLPRRKIVHFSTHHCIGLYNLPDVDGFFSSDPDRGFVEYFDLIHGTMARFAIENPDVEVVIKPKWEQGWIRYIESAIVKVTGVSPANIPNLIITAKVPAQTLIEESSVVVGINSTTLLEAILFGRRVIMPLFAEAAGKYFDKHVYFHKYLHEFNTPRSPEKMMLALKNELNEETPDSELNRSLIEDYLGPYDGNVAARLVDQIRTDIIGFVN